MLKKNIKLQLCYAKKKIYLFSWFAFFCGCRRDSFITHRAFCDALAQESSRVVNPHPLLSTQFRSHGLQLQAPSLLKREHDHFNLLTSEIPSWLTSPIVVEEAVLLNSQTIRTTSD